MRWACTQNHGIHIPSDKKKGLCFVVTVFAPHRMLKVQPPPERNLSPVGDSVTSKALATLLWLHLAKQASGCWLGMVLSKQRRWKMHYCSSPLSTPNLENNRTKAGRTNCKGTHAVLWHTSFASSWPTAVPLYQGGKSRWIQIRIVTQHKMYGQH